MSAIEIAVEMMLSRLTLATTAERNAAYAAAIELLAPNGWHTERAEDYKLIYRALKSSGHNAWAVLAHDIEVSTEVQS